ncbi:class III signal peptide-containing protein [Candidatus Micrarchaeota archaeon]|nr:class III signal peptide-containing protein [Candidatus Micrarchaeota archaeon]
MNRRGQGAFEYVLLLGGVLLVVAVFIYTLQGGFAGVEDQVKQNQQLIFQPNLLAPLFEDDFSSGLTKWTNYGGSDWGIVADDLVATKTIGSGLIEPGVVVENSWVDYSLSVRVSAVSGDLKAPVLLTRYRDAGNFYAIQLSDDYVVFRPKINGVLSGSIHQEFVSNGFPVAGNTYLVKVIAAGDNLKVFIDDKLSFDYNVPVQYQINSGGIGLSHLKTNNLNVVFDDVVVLKEKPPVSTPTPSITPTATSTPVPTTTPSPTPSGKPTATPKPPVVKSITATPKPALIGDSVEYSAVWTNPSTNGVLLKLCSSIDFNSGSCTEKELCNAKSTESPASCKAIASEVGSFKYYAYACDSVDVTRCSVGKAISLTVKDFKPPTISSIIYAPKPASAGKPIQYSITWTNPSGEGVLFKLCSTNSIDLGECVDSQICASSSVESPTICDSTAPAKGSYKYYAFACDSISKKCSPAKAISISVK